MDDRAGRDAGALIVNPKHGVLPIAVLAATPLPPAAEMSVLQSCPLIVKDSTLYHTSSWSRSAAITSVGR